MNDFIYISIIVLLMVFILLALFRYLPKKNIEPSKDNEIFEELSKKVDSLHTKLELENNNINNNLKNTAENLKTAMKITAENTERSTNAVRVEAQKISNILQDNTKRGAWGEKAADDLLNAMGMIEGKSYYKQKKLSWNSEDNKELRPDYAFPLDGDDSKLFIMDSKFPMSNYNNMFDENGDPVSDIESQKKLYLNEFKKRIQEVKKYINPSENSFDFAAMFIPIPTLLDETLRMDSNIIDYAMENKIVLVSPINFYALVSFIKHSETLLKVTREQKSIIKIFGSLKEQWGKYEASFEKVEDRLTQLSKEIETVKTTRTKAMSRELNKVDNILNSNSIEKGD